MGGAGGMGAGEDSDDEEEESKEEPHGLTSKLEKVEITDDKNEEAKTGGTGDAAADMVKQAEAEVTAAAKNQSAEGQAKVDAAAADLKFEEASPQATQQSESQKQIPEVTADKN